MNVEAVLQRLQSAYQVNDLTTLAVCLGMDENNFRVWRTRGVVSQKSLMKATQDTGKSVTWLKDGYDSASAALVLHEPMSYSFASKEKQINLSPQEKALLENYRAASEEGRVAIDAAGFAMAKSNLKKRRAA